MPAQPQPPQPRPSKWRRLWSRRLRRRPLLPFLFLAFAVVDVAVLAFDFDNAKGAVFTLILLGLVLGQVSLLGVWVVSRVRGLLARLLIAIPVAVLVTTPLAIALPDPHVVVMTFVVVFLLVSTAVAAAISTVRSRLRSGLRTRPRVRYKVGLLLTAMTIVPFAIYAVQNGRWDVFGDSAVILSISCELAALACMLILAAAIRSDGLLALAYSVTMLGLLAAQYAIGSPKFALLSFNYYLGYLVSVGGGLVALRQGQRKPSAGAPVLQQESAAYDSGDTSIDLIA